MVEESQDAIGRIVGEVLRETEFREWADDEEYLRGEVLRRADTLLRRAVRPGSMGQTRGPGLDDAHRDLELTLELAAEGDKRSRRFATIMRILVWAYAVLVVTGLAAAAITKSAPFDGSTVQR